MKRLQIGVIGSMADLDYSAQEVALAKQAGQVIAEAGSILVFGAEKDADSLPTVAARSARQNGGLTVGVTYEKGLAIFDTEAADIVIATGLVRGGGREMVQSLSCDGVIAVSGGSGTLNELTVAYQANIPAVFLASKTGWANKLDGEFLDGRQRYQYASYKNAITAYAALLQMIQERQI